MSDSNPPKSAVEKHRRWAGWIWAIPIATLLIVGYLTVKEFAQSGPDVTVTFASAGGVKPGDTKVQYEGLDVGSVQSVTLQKDLQHVNVVLAMDSDMAGHLGPGTRFWISGQQPSLSNLSSIKAVLTGPFIGIEPHPGHTQNHYQGLSQPPAEKEVVAGTHYTLQASTLGTIGRDSPIYYKGLKVGTVVSTQLQPDGHHFDVAAFVRAPFDKLVHKDTRFWNASAIQFSMAGSGPRVQFQSLPALFSGAVDFETPDHAAGTEQAQPDSFFQLFGSKGAAENAPFARSVRYRVAFQGADAGGLQAGAPVQLDNKRVGSVVDSALQFDPTSGHLIVQATIAIDPDDIDLLGGATWHSNPRPQMNDLLRTLIGQGLRASLSKSPPLVGTQLVSLQFVPNASPAALGSGNVPEIPTGAGSSIDGLITSVSEVGAKLDAMPLDQIADDIHQTTQRLARLSKSPQLRDSLEHLDQATANVDAITQETRGKVGPLLAKLNRVANEAASTVASARTLIKTNGQAMTAPETANLGHTLYELSRAAQSLRTLADYLDRHPEAILRGRS